MNILTEKDHDDLDCCISAILDAYKEGKIDNAKATGDIVTIMAAIDDGNIDEARTWIEQGIKLISR